MSIDIGVKIRLSRFLLVLVQGRKIELIEI